MVGLRDKSSWWSWHLGICAGGPGTSPSLRNWPEQPPPRTKDQFRCTTQRHVTLTLAVGVCPEFQITVHFPCFIPNVPYSDGWNMYGILIHNLLGPAEGGGEKAISSRTGWKWQGRDQTWERCFMSYKGQDLRPLLLRWGKLLVQVRCWPLWIGRKPNLTHALAKEAPPSCGYGTFSPWGAAILQETGTLQFMQPVFLQPAGSFCHCNRDKYISIFITAIIQFKMSLKESENYSLEMGIPRTCPVLPVQETGLCLAAP